VWGLVADARCIRKMILNKNEATFTIKCHISNICGDRDCEGK